MKEFINVAHASGVYNDKSITATSNPWVITLQDKCKCICECVCENFCICELCCITECYVYNNGVQQFEFDGMTVIKVGYRVCIKYLDCDGKNKIVTKEGNVLFIEQSEMFGNDYTVRIPNPPCIKVCCDRITVEFMVKLCY